MLLELSDIDVNAKDDAGETALHYLARLEVKTEEQKQLLLSVVKRMKTLKVKINKENNKGESPLLIAVRHSQATMVEWLIGMRANALARNE